MRSWPDAPLRPALELLALEGRAGSGAYRVGGRTIELRRGRIASVSRLDDVDATFGAFLHGAGRVTASPDALDAVDLEGRVLAGDDAIEGQTALSLFVLRDLLRAVWIERLARVFALAPQAALERLPEEPLQAEHAHDVSTLALVLDALERHAAEGDAEAVGARAQEWVRFGPSALVARAKRWAQFEGPNEIRVASLLASNPAASRIAALGRAGLLEIAPATEQGLPAPTSRRPPRSSAPAAPSGPPASRAPSAPPPALEARSSLAPPRRPDVVLAPGETRVALALDLTETFPSFTLGAEALMDPLEDAERDVAALEAAGASPASRAVAWRRVAELARTELGALDEWARAAREAASADPEDPALLADAAQACAATHEVDLALAYGKAAVGVARSNEARARALSDYALLAQRLGQLEEAARAAGIVTQLAPDDPAAHRLRAQIALGAGEREEAAESFAEATTLLAEEDDERALYTSARAYRAQPDAARAIELFAGRLARGARADTAIEVRAERARLAQDPHEAQRVLLAAAERAEARGAPDRSAALLLEAFDADRGLDLVWGALESDLGEADARLERAILLEEIALEAGSDASEWWQRAADARRAIDPGGELELELRVRALEAAPTSEPAREALCDFAARTGRRDARLVGLERAIRGPNAAAPRRRELAAELEREAQGHPALLAWARAIAETGSVPTPSASVPAMDDADALEAAAMDPSRRAASVAAALRALEAREDLALERALERIARYEGRPASVAAILARSAARATTPAERAALTIGAAFYARLGRDEATLRAACEAAIAGGVASEEIALRLRRTRSGVSGDAASRDAARATGWAAEADVTRGAARARALVELARGEEARGERARAAALARSALEEDPRFARAALTLLRTDDGEGWAPSLAPVADAYRALVGDTAETLRAVALSREDAAEALATTVRWAALDPLASEPILVSLALGRRHALPEYEDAAIEALLSSWRTEPAVVPALLEALDRLAERDPDRGFDRLVEAAIVLGPSGRAFADRAFALAVVRGDRGAVVRAAECLLVGPEEDRAAALRHIAHLRRDRADRAGEARTWARLLAVAPRDDEALHRLAQIYAEAGDRDRFIASLALRVEEGSSPHERAIGHLELAAAFARTLAEPEQAEAHLAAAEAELETLEGDEDDTSAEHASRLSHLGLALLAMGRAERGLTLLLTEARRAEGADAVGLYESAIAAALLAGGPSRALAITEEALLRCGMRGKLMLAFEQLTLDAHDVESAERVYALLIDAALGAHGRRALAYRRARWLDRAGAHERALEAYVEACEQQSGGGALLTALERLARSVEQPSSLARGLEALARNASHPTIRLSLLRRTARLYADELHDPERALQLLATEWTRTLSSELEPDVLSLLASAMAHARRAAEPIAEQLLDVIERHAAEAWMGEERASLLRKAMRLTAAGLGDEARAEAYALRAVAALSDEDAEPEARRAPLDELASLLRARGVEPPLDAWLARAGLTDVLPTVPGSLLAPSLDEAKVPEESAHVEPEERPAPRVDAEAEPEPEPEPSDEPLPITSTRTEAEARAPKTTPRAWRALAREGGASSDEASELGLRASFVDDPRRVSDLEELARRGGPTTRAVARRILAVTESEDRAEPLSLDTAELDASSELFRHASLDGARELLRRLWENARHLFKKTTRDLGVIGTDRVGAHDTSPIGLATARVARLLSISEPVIFQVVDRQPRRAEVLPTTPPSVRISTALGREGALLDYELARALELARPEHVLVATQPEPDRQILFDAIVAAFGPATAVHASSRRREVAMLTANLWSTLPPLVQSALRDDLERAGGSFRNEGVTTAIHAGAARLGLVACGDPLRALQAEFLLDPALGDLDRLEPGALARAIERSAIVRDLVRFAMSDGFLALVSPRDDAG